MAVLSRVLPWLGILMAVTACRTGPQQWGPFRAQVIDSATGEPIAGAHVMVMWIREPPSFHFTQWFYDAEETITDTAGRFEIPRKTRLLTAFVREPGIAVFAPGYLMQAPEVTPQNGHAYIEPTVVRMRPLTSLAERCKYRPGGLWLEADEKAPRFKNAIQEYNRGLKCG